LQPYWHGALADLEAVSATMTFFSGWSREQSLAAALTAHLSKDQERGSTSYGPHRFDVVLRLDGHPARDRVSRGQQKPLGAALALTMCRYISNATGDTPALLLDDPAAELDLPHTEALLNAVAKLGGQLIVTSLRPEHTSLGEPDRVFHVEHGGVKRL
jgi:DNA replication and repair protein RecF